MNRRKIIGLALTVCSLAACAQKKKIYESPEGYNLNHPVRFAMPEDLHEISGIAFYQGNPDTLYAEQDEEGKVYFLRPGAKKARHVRFGDQGDYEDIAFCGGYLIMLRSDGVLFDFPFQELREGEITGVRKWKDLLPKGEYESLYADPETRQLVLLSKNSRHDNKTGKVSGFVLQLHPDGSISLVRGFEVDPGPLARLSGMQGTRFKPSALARDPHTGTWYLLSSVNKLLVLTDSLWKIKQVYPLDPSLFIQPEGIAFDNERNLYISNEGDKITPGTVLKFAFLGSQ